MNSTSCNRCGEIKMYPYLEGWGKITGPQEYDLCARCFNELHKFLQDRTKAQNAYYDMRTTFADKMADKAE